MLIGTQFTLINLYGLTQSIRPAGLWDEPTRFENDYSISYNQALQQLKRKAGESELAFAKRITHVISQSITHIHWNEEPDNTRFNQLIPIWENYFLYFMGLWSGIPEYEKYHYTNYRRSLKRGIGLCGDTSMIMERVLAENSISAQILVYPLHVVVQAQVDGQNRLFDADYGVSLPFNSDNVKENIDDVMSLYREQGYGPNDEELAYRIYTGKAWFFDGVPHFVTNKYYFEKIAYALKWPLPIFCWLLGLYLLFWKRKVNG